MPRRNQRSCLLHVLAEHFAQTGMQEMRCGVVAHGGFAKAAVDYGIDFVGNTNRLLRDHLVRAHTLDGVVTAGHVSDDGVVIVGVEPSSIADLTARLSVERRMVENDFALLSRFEFLSALAAFHDRQHFATVRSRLPVAFEHRGWQLLIGGIGGLLGGTFPGGASTLALLGHGTVETGL